MFGIFISTLAFLGQLSGPLQPFGTYKTTLAQHQMSLDDRYPDTFVNGIFKDNILLNISYLDDSTTKGNVNWNQVEKPFHYSFTLKPGQSFAFHDTLLPQYQGKVVKTTNAHFNAQEGFKSDGYLFGDGVCHLASLINWSAKDAGLEVYAPTNHDFANIPDIPRQFGVAIYSAPGSSSDEMENLYITNNKLSDVTFVFDYSGDNLNVSVEQNTSSAI